MEIGYSARENAAPGAAFLLHREFRFRACVGQERVAQ